MSEIDQERRPAVVLGQCFNQCAPYADNWLYNSQFAQTNLVQTEPRYQGRLQIMELEYFAINQPRQICDRSWNPLVGVNSLMVQMLQSRLSPPSCSRNKKNTHLFTTLNCPCSPLFRKIPFGFMPPCALLLSLNRPLSISCLPPSRTWLFLAIASGFCPTRLSIA